MALHQFDYIFAIAMIFAFLDAWNIGANDVANSFATSVSSRSLTYPQAMILAAICEFLGAVLAGSRVSDTIRNNIIEVNMFNDAPAGLMLTMACALFGSSIWMTIATKIGAPVSTTHSIVGGIIGAGIAANGASGVAWGWSGFAKIIASWFVSPLVAGGFASILFLITKYTVLERKNSLRNAMLIIPFYFALTAGVLIMVIVWKGAPNLKLDNLSQGQILGAIFGGAGTAAGLYFIFWYPYLYRKLILEDWTLKIYHIVYGPFLLIRGEVPPIPEGVNHKIVTDYYHGNRNQEEIEAAIDSGAAGVDKNVVASEPIGKQDIESKDAVTTVDAVDDNTDSAAAPVKLDAINKKTIKLLLHPRNWHRLIWLAVSHGFTQDVIGSQKEKTALSSNIEDMHSRAKKYDNKTEHLYSFLQGVTACTASFAHGSNDISNAAGPLSTIYLIWSKNTTGENSPVPVWVLCYTAGALVIGLWTYGYNIMRNLGNRLTLQSPARGFSMELGAAITTVFATQLSLPISTTQCIVGAVVFVGLCNGDVKAVNWRMVAWCYAGWIFTLPCAGLIAGITMGIISNAPQLGAVYTME
jgi:sodium-dependent phosphate transporter